MSRRTMPSDQGGGSLLSARLKAIADRDLADRTITSGEASEILEALDEAARNERDLRREWWGNHGHDYHALYGDDGEMCCNACRPPADFKRQPLDELREAVLLGRAESVSKVWPM